MFGPPDRVTDGSRSKFTISGHGRGYCGMRGTKTFLFLRTILKLMVRWNDLTGRCATSYRAVFGLDPFDLGVEANQSRYRDQEPDDLAGCLKSVHEETL